MPNAKKKGIAHYLNTYWKVVIAIIFIVLAWGRMEDGIKTNAEAVERISKIVEQMRSDITMFQTNVAEIKTSLKYIEREITK